MEASGPRSAVKTPPGAAARQTVVKRPAGPRLLGWPQDGGCSLPGYSDPRAFTSRVRLRDHLHLSTSQPRPRHLPRALTDRAA